MTMSSGETLNHMHIAARRVLLISYLDRVSCFGMRNIYPGTAAGISGYGNRILFPGIVCALWEFTYM